MALDNKQITFIDTYLQTFSIEQSAIKAGYEKANALKIGMDLLATTDIQDALAAREKELEVASNSMKMTKERLLRTMWYQYAQANRKDRTNDAISVLEKIAKWSGVNPDEVQLDPIKLIINNLDEDKL